MIQSLSQSTRRRILVLAAAIAAQFLSYFSIRNALAAHFAGLQTLEGLEHATHLEPGNARNWYLLGRYWQYSFEDSDIPHAIRAYLLALSFNPHSAETWLDLATAYESENNFAAARDAFLHAKGAYPLSADVYWRYGNFLLRQGELDPALAEIRRAVESDPKVGAEAFSRALRGELEVGMILDRVLPSNPDVYVDVISDQVTQGQTEIALKVWDRLAAIHLHVRLRDVFTLVDDLMTKKRIPEAKRVWDQGIIAAGMQDLQGPPASVLWDGGFESGIAGGGFAWRIPDRVYGVQISRDVVEKHSGSHSLRLVFDGKNNVNFSELCHYVPVEPSTEYRFSAWERTRELKTDQGVRFQLRSVGGNDSPVVVTTDVHGNEPWTKIENIWTSGKGVQEMQVCLLRYPSDQEGHRIHGTAWIDDVALTPESMGHFKP